MNVLATNGGTLAGLHGATVATQQQQVTTREARDNELLGY